MTLRWKSCLNSSFYLSTLALLLKCKLCLRTVHNIDCLLFVVMSEILSCI